MPPHPVASLFGSGFYPCKSLTGRTIGKDVLKVELGWPIGMPYCRPLGDGLWEVRSDLAKGIARILFTIVGDEMVLLHGFMKKTQKTPPQDLDLALKRKREIE